VAVIVEIIIVMGFVIVVVVCKDCYYRDCCGGDCCGGDCCGGDCCGREYREIFLYSQLQFFCLQYRYRLLLIL
jgi:hypothetical protein